MTDQRSSAPELHHHASQVDRRSDTPFRDYCRNMLSRQSLRRRSGTNAAPLKARLAVCALAVAFGPSAGAADVVQAWVTTADQSRLLTREPDVSFAAQAPPAIRIDVDPERRYQEMVGFGAAVTDSSAWLIENRLNEAQRSGFAQGIVRPRRRAWIELHPHLNRRIGFLARPLQPR